MLTIEITKEVCPRLRSYYLLLFTSAFEGCGAGGRGRGGDSRFETRTIDHDHCVSSLIPGNSNDERHRERGRGNNITRLINIPHPIPPIPRFPNHHHHYTISMISTDRIDPIWTSGIHACMHVSTGKRPIHEFRLFSRLGGSRRSAEVPEEVSTHQVRSTQQILPG